MKFQKGMTLIELVVVVAILAVLATIAIPSYSQYIIRGNRRAAQAVMMEIATRQMQHFAANREFATEADLGYVLPDDVADHYTYEIELDAGPPPGFTIEFTPYSGRQAEDVVLTLNSAGVKTPEENW
jgi:type IV pilus assembly protein PilE